MNSVLEHHILTAGPAIYPLLLCSIVLLALILERIIVLSMYPANIKPVYLDKFKRNQLSDESVQGKKGAAQGLLLLAQHQQQPKELRDELLSVWLSSQQQILHARIRWLTLIGVLAPLLGLLGTVLGIINMFQEVSHEVGPVTPALLASGMWEAMATTALGLVVAIPALGFGQAFGIWSDYRLEKISKVLNQSCLWQELSNSNPEVEHDAEPQRLAGAA